MQNPTIPPTPVGLEPPPPVGPRADPMLELPASGTFAAEPHHVPALIGLFDAVFGPGSGEAHARRFAWQYFGGAYPGAALRVIWHQGRPVATLGSLPSRLLIEGIPHPARFTADLGAHPAYRSRGLGARLLREFVEAPGIPLAFAVSDDARAVLCRLGFEEVPMTMMFCVLRLEALAQRRFGVALRDGRLGPPTRWLLEAVDRLRPAWEGSARSLALMRAHAQEAGTPSWGDMLRAPATEGMLRRRKRSARLEVSWTDDFPDETEPLVEQVARSWPVALMPTAEALCQRYLHHPHHRHSIALARREGRLTGLAIWRTYADSDGLRMAHLSDLFCDASDDDAQDTLLQAGLDRLRRENVFAVKALASCRRLERALSRQLFLPHGSPPGLLFFAPDEALRARLRGPWLIGLGASDADVSG